MTVATLANVAALLVAAVCHVAPPNENTVIFSNVVAAFAVAQVPVIAKGCVFLTLGQYRLEWRTRRA